MKDAGSEGGFFQSLLLWNNLRELILTDDQLQIFFKRFATKQLGILYRELLWSFYTYLIIQSM